MGPSELVQEAVRRLVADRRLPYEGAPHVDEARLRQIRERKRAEAQELFNRGYDTGLDVAERYDWEFLDWAASFDFDFERLRLQGSRDMEELGEAWNLETVLPEVGRRGRVFDEGVRRALRDVWQGVLSHARPEDKPGGEAPSEAATED